MFVSTRRHKHGSFEIWPGFVDALSTILMVIIFVLMTFVVAQLYLTEAITGKDEAIHTLKKKMDLLTTNLSNATDKNTQHTKKIVDLEKATEDFKNSILSLENNLTTERSQKEKFEQENTSLVVRIRNMEENLKRISEALEVSESSKKTSELKLNEIQSKLNKALLEKVEELQKLNDQLDATRGKNPAQSSIGQYRSEFFSKLKQAIGDRSDIRIVGDRFVFQSELFFDLASAELSEEGKNQLDKLSKALKDITDKIPTSVKWLLRVDGHTDQIPIHHKFASNWELSTARAISVVKHLIQKGIEPNRLVAAGFGEHQPLTDGKNNSDLARNRRIEFKLDQR